ncbi:hypothetical protein [Nostoc linckia]|uniref:hypothetical protein n=1 Tax=Nostoc linckia TaxID=92942 RepID=UPI00117C0E67|nr:hypothetical protein [Nostoc linckia]
MVTLKKAVEVSFVNLETGDVVKFWRTTELLEYLQISLATFKRDKALLIEYCPELKLFKKSRVYSDRQRHGFDVLRDWRELGYEGENLRFKLSEEGLTPYVDYQTRIEKTPGRMSECRRNQRHP